MIKYLLNCTLIIGIFSNCFSADSTFIFKADTLLKSAIFFSRSHPDSALNILDKAYQIAIENEQMDKWFLLQMGDIFREKGNICFRKSKFSEAVDYYMHSVKKYKKFGDSKNPKSGLAAKNMAGVYVNMGVAYTNLGNFDKALEYYFNALETYEKLKDNYGIASCHLGIGNLQYYQGDMDKAIATLIIASKYYEMADNKSGMANCFNSLGGINYSKNDFKAALNFFSKMLKLKKELDDKQGVSTAHTNLANVYMATMEYSKALDNFQLALTIDKELGDVYNLSIVQTDMAWLYLKISENIKNNPSKKWIQLKNALDLGLEAFENANKMNVLPLINNIAELLLKVNILLGKTDKALDFVKIYIETKDSMYQDEKTKSIAEMETKYQTVQKQLEIENLNQQKELQARLILLLSLGIAFTISIVFVVFRFYKVKKKANGLLALQNAEILLQKEEIISQRDEIEAQRDMVVQQKHQIELIHSELTSNIEYARQIQNTLLPNMEHCKSFFLDNFLVFKPRDGVSGDFYWLRAADEKVSFCVADCTGHGVTGSLMSMLGISFLNEIFQTSTEKNPAAILEILREKIIDALQQKGIRGDYKDGIDIALCLLNLKTLKLEFAGAMNPCWIIPNNLNNPSLSNLNAGIIELEANKMPVAIHYSMMPFTQHVIQLQKGDQVYLFTDGFADQNGGEKNKKIQSSRLKEILTENKHLTMEEQKNKLENYFDAWKGANPQIDDVTILGIKI